MPLFSRSELRFLGSVADLAYSNPFLPERLEWERAALGSEFRASGLVWSASVLNPDAVSPNAVRIREKLELLMSSLRERLASAPHITSEEWTVYEESGHYLLYERYYQQFVSAQGRWRFYKDFLADWNQLYRFPQPQAGIEVDPAHLFSCFRQVQRAFGHIFDNIIGNSMPAARLRASVWQSIFTHDMRRYRRLLYRKMGDFPTLITGPSGTGKELVARAIAASRYVPFDPVRLEFADPPAAIFLPINIAALSHNLIESELFGHRRGAFTGAVSDRKGWLETCPASGSVFLDELGEMDLSIQVKLLRVLETRNFSPVGDTGVRTFSGKLITATNRNLPEEIRAGRFREDLYYRLCADLIRTPSLAEQLEDSPDVLHPLLLFMTRRAVGEEAEQLLPEVEHWVRTHLPAGYRWPGNYRELEQCVRNIVIRRSYHPMEQNEAGAHDNFFTCFERGQLTADELLSYYAALVYRQTGSYEEAARRLGLDRRTVKAKVETYLAKTTDSAGSADAKCASQRGGNTHAH
jgi:transcriptional regulator with AAA-type ATPase domain